MDLKLDKTMPVTWLTMHLFHKNFAPNLAEFEWVLRRTDMAYERVERDKEAFSALQKCMQDIMDSNLKIDAENPPSFIGPRDIEVMCVDPEEFFEWASSKGYQLSQPILRALEELKSSIRPCNFKEHRLNKDDLLKIKKKPSWDMYEAVMFMHSYKGCDDFVLNRKCIDEDPELSELYVDSLAAYRTGELSLIEGSTKSFDRPAGWETLYSVTPSDYIRWCKSRKLKSDIYKTQFTGHDVRDASDKCLDYLISIMKENPEPPPENREKHYALMVERFPALTWSGYKYARREAIKKTGSNWAKRGRRQSER